VISKGGVMISYEPLRAYIAVNNIKKKDIMISTGISAATMWKLKHDKIVSVEIIDRLCEYFKCDIQKIIIYKNEKGK
jgi:DNA-binding Xre family transcriptional regulator